MAVRQNALANDLLDRLIILWVMPPIGFLISVMQVPELRYFISNQAILGVLIVAGVFGLHARPVSRRVLALLLLSITLMAAFLCIEWIHFLAGRKTIDDLTDLRMVIYSPFYGSIMIFVLYAIYLTSLDGGQRRAHLAFVVKTLSWFHIVFCGYWLLLYFGWVEPIPRTDLLHSNSVSYAALFVLCVLLFYRDSFDLNAFSYRAFIVINVAVIFLNQTRGAIIGLMLIVGYLFVMSASNAGRAVLARSVLGILFGVVTLLMFMQNGVMAYLFGKDNGSLGAVLHAIADAYERGEHLVVASPVIINDESSLSAFSRIGSNYYSFLSFLDNPIMGIGQTEAYSISVLGSGVHSLHFLIASSTGILGLMLFTALVMAIMFAQSSINVSLRIFMVFFLFFGYALVYNNSLPVYFSIIVTLLASEARCRSPWARQSSCIRRPAL